MDGRPTYSFTGGRSGDQDGEGCPRSAGRWRRSQLFHGRNNSYHDWGWLPHQKSVKVSRGRQALDTIRAARSAAKRRADQIVHG